MRHTTRGTAATLTLGLALTSALAGCTGSARDTDAVDTGPVKLVAFDSCDQALGELKRRAKPYVGPYGFQFGGGVEGDMAGGARDSAPNAAGAPGAAPGEKSTGEHSTTNTHEAGVDEPDMVKTDGKRIVTVIDGVLRVVDVASRKQTGELSLTDSDAQTPADPYGVQLLVRGDRALVVVPGYQTYRLPDGPTRETPADYPVSGPKLLLVDLSGEPRVLSRMTIDGSYVDARMVGGNVRLVTQSAPRVPFRYPTGNDRPADLQQDNRVRFEKSTVDDWLPRYSVTTGGSTTTGRVGCEHVSRPTAYSGTSMLTVTTLGLDATALSGKASITIAADGRTVYGTGTSLYVANDQQLVRPFEARAEVAPPKPRTEIYEFDVSKPGAPRYTASGVVPGWLINQYAMSEYDGRLRVATTTGQPWGGPERDEPRTESAVYVLAAKDLDQVGKVGGLGKGERIYAVRFAGPVGYVVTFRQMDPLYVVDLRDPEHPKVTGELKISGYSAYLHPAGGGRLIGVGQEGDANGQRLGTQVSLFDVRDPAHPNRLARHHVKYGNSNAEFDPHAFLYWPKTGLLVIPVTTYQPTDVQEKPVGPQGGALVLKVGDNSLTEVGTVAHPGQRDYRGMVQRSLYIDGTLWTVSREGLQANDAGNLDKQAWIPFE